MRKFFSKIGVCALALAIAFTTFATPAVAGSFTHVHTDSCKKKVTKTCSDHELVYGRDRTSAHCGNCGCTRDCQMDGWTDICHKGLAESEFVGWKITCLTCGNVIEDRGQGQKRSHQYSVVERVCGKSTDTVVATVAASASSTGWTNKTVDVKVNVSISDSSFSVSSITFNGEGSSGSETVSENGTYTFTVNGNNGQSVSESVTVSNIDKTAPTVSLSKSTDAWTEEGVTISASASDDLSGVAGISFNGGEYGGGTSWHVSSNGTYSVTVKDNAGNSSGASITVSNIGKDPAVLEEERRREEEEERRRKEEEEERRREEEEKERKDEEINPGNNDQREEPKPEKEDNGPVEPGDKGGEEKPKIIPLIFEREEKDDVSASDISENDVSGNLVTLTDTGNRTGNKTTIEKKPPELVLPTDSGTKLSLWQRFLNNPLALLFGGLALISFAFLIISSVNYVYIKDGDKVKPVSLARVKPQKEKFFVKVSNNNLLKNTKYRVFYSPISKFLKKGRDVVIDVNGHSVPLSSEDGSAFVYNC